MTIERIFSPKDPNFYTIDFLSAFLLLFHTLFSLFLHYRLCSPQGLANGPQNEPYGANSAGKKALRYPFIAQNNPFYKFDKF